jgi:NADPH:quinone reductase-like Zn-dependent oxidoreductase
MKAAVVSSFGSPPRYQEFPVPTPGGSNEMLVDVLAAALHPRVRSQASGSHYTSTGELPLVPGVDGVGRGPDGQLRYFMLPDTTMGSMAAQTVIDVRRSVVLPDSTDPVAVAAAMNPAMSSWVALRQRTRFEAGQDVLILGATGNAGRMAVQVARHLGANQVIAAGRNPERMADLPATATVALEDVKIAADVDVVIDYLWGEPTVAAMTAIVTGRADRGKPLTWIQIGAVAGATAAIPSAALRASRLTIVGSGQGSVSTREYLAELPALAEELTAGTFDVNATAVPLADVEQTWTAPAKQRVVFVP